MNILKEKVSFAPVFYARGILCLFLILFFALIHGVSYCQQPTRVKMDVINFIKEDGLAEGTPVTVTVDPGNWVWIGFEGRESDGKGGFSIINKNKKVLSFSKEDGISDDNVRKILTDAEGNGVWFATDNGLCRWGGEKGEWKILNKTTSSLKSNKITSLYRDQKGRLYAGTKGGGLYRIKDNKNDWDAEPLKCPFDDITCMMSDSKGRFWVGSQQGIAYQQKDTWVPYTEANSTLPSNNINDIVEGGDGKIFAGTQRGIAVFDGITWNIMDTSNSGLPVDTVRDLYVDGNGNLWACTWGGGIAKFDSKLQKFEIYSRKNSDIPDNKVSSLALDSNGNMWVATERGVSNIVVNPDRVVPEMVTARNLTGYSWQRSEDKPVNISCALPMNRYGYVVWGWSAYFVDKQYDNLDPDVKLQWGIFDNRWLTIIGDFPGIDILQMGFTEGKVTRHYSADRTIGYPFPDELPMDVRRYLKSGKLIPSDNQEIMQRANSLVRKSSKGDMFRTAEDIIFSKIFTTMPYDSSTDEIFQGKSCVDVQDLFEKDILKVLKNRKGSSYSKNLLACSMLKSAGIPSRLIARDSSRYHGEAYINGWGWVPFDVSMPVYTMNEKNIARRIIFPLVPDGEELGTVWVSGSDEDIITLDWKSDVKADITMSDKIAEDLLNIRKLSTAKLLLIRTSDFDTLPEEVRIPVSQKVTMMLKKDGEFYNLRFYEGTKLLKKFPIKEYYQTMSVDMPNRFQLTFSPFYMGEYLGLRIFQWKVYDLPTEEPAEKKETGKSNQEAGQKPETKTESPNKPKQETNTGNQKPKSDSSSSTQYIPDEDDNHTKVDKLREVNP